MKLSELIARYGDENVTFQKLDDCVSSSQITKQGSRATFVTPEKIDLDGFAKLGLIVWFDRARVAEIIAAEKGGAA
jgi:hypothetical protein